MENNMNNQPDCECGSDCYQPKKNNKLWTKIVFTIVMVAAVAIVTIKLVNKNTEGPVAAKDSLCCPKACSDTSGVNLVQITNPGENPPCCPKSKK